MANPLVVIPPGAVITEVQPNSPTGLSANSQWPGPSLGSRAQLGSGGGLGCGCVSVGTVAQLPAAGSTGAYMYVALDNTLTTLVAIYAYNGTSWVLILGAA
jgi:hypothetical protein